MIQTTLVLFITMCAEITYGLLGIKFHPFNIIKFKLFSLLLILPILAFTFDDFETPFGVFVVQVLIIVLGQGLTPASPLINKSFPTFGRYTSLLLIWALSHSLIYLFTAYVCETVTSFSGLCVLLFCAALISLVGLYSFVPEPPANTP